jgi:hypothetical protein
VYKIVLLILNEKFRQLAQSPREKSPLAVLMNDSMKNANQIHFIAKTIRKPIRTSTFQVKLGKQAISSLGSKNCFLTLSPPNNSPKE